MYTFTFRVMVPPQMRIDDNQVQRQYQNKLSGSYGSLVLATNDGGHDDSMKVLVVPQIQIIKTVAPTQQIFGQPVTYTLVVSNSYGAVTSRVASLTVFGGGQPGANDIINVGLIGCGGRGNYVASLGRLVKWMAKEAEGLGVDVFCEFPGRELLYDGVAAAS